MNWNTKLILISACVSCSLGRPSARAGYGGYVRYGDSHTSYGYGDKHQTHGGNRHVNFGYTNKKQHYGYGNSYNHHYGNYGNKPHPQPLPAPSPFPIPSPHPAPFPAPSPIEDIDLPQGPLTIVRPSLRIDPSQLAAPSHHLTPSHRSPKSYSYAHHLGHKTHYGTYGYKPAYPAPHPPPSPIQPVYPAPLPVPSPIQPVHPVPSPLPAPIPIEDIDLPPQGPLTIVRPSFKSSKLIPAHLPVIPSSLKSSQLFIPVSTNQVDLLQEPFMDLNNHQEESININNDQFEMKSFVQPEQSKSVDSFIDELLNNFQNLPEPFIDIQNDQFGEKIPFLPEAYLDIQNEQFGVKIPIISEPSMDNIKKEQFGRGNEFLPEPFMNILDHDEFVNTSPFLPDPVPAVPVQTQHIVFPDEDNEQLLEFLSQSQDKTLEQVPVFSLQNDEEFSAIPGGSLQAVPAVPGLPVLSL